ncbi:MAG: hypothetical protein JXM69_04445 [Anaerolineae bacterium]|nr:hypothetical protein [Anaerolineae bacterium]
MTEQSNTSGFWQSFGRFMRGLIRLVLFALIVAVIVVVVYYSIPYIYNYMQNRGDSQVVTEDLRRDQAQMQEDFTNQLANQRERIVQLEAELTAEREARSQLEITVAQQGETLSAQATAQTEMENMLQTQGQTPAVPTELAERLDAQAKAIAGLEQQVDSLDTTLANLDSTAVGLEQMMAEPVPEVDNLQQQMLILQAGQAVLKAQLHLSENNPGQAQLALTRVDLALNRLTGLVSPGKGEALAEIQAQLQTAIVAIEEQPFIAGQELEILWELLQRFADS